MVRKFLGKIRELYLNLRKLYYIIFINKNSQVIFNSKILFNLNFILNSVNTTLQEAITLLKYKKLNKIDKKWLYATIKKEGHFIEKLMFFPKNDKNEKLNNLNYHRLKSSLEKWDKNGYEKTEPIKWAQKILNDFEASYPNGCPNCRFEKNQKSDSILIDPDDLLKLLKSRRSRRFFSDSYLNEREKEYLIEAGNYAPSSCNGQLLNFLFIEDPELKEFVSNCITGGKEFFNSAPIILLILADRREYRYPDGRFTPYQDAAAAIQNILLMAESLDLACCWGSLTSYGDILNEPELRKRCNIPEFFLITGSIAIGHKSHETLIIPRDQVKSKYSIDKFNYRKQLLK